MATNHKDIISMARKIKLKNDPPNSYWEIQRARSEKMRELMAEYDREVYYPALKEIQEQCVREHGEHLKSTWHRNGLGWAWWYCNRCGASHSKEQLP